MNRMIIVASLAVFSLLPYQALSLGEGVSATDKRFEGKFHFSFENILFCKRIIHTSNKKGKFHNCSFFLVQVSKGTKNEVSIHLTSDGEITTGKENDFTCPDRWGYYGDPKNCIKYYVCKDGFPTRMVCQKGNETQ